MTSPASTITKSFIPNPIINWKFYWWNLSYRMDAELAQITIPITLLIVSLFQLPRFIPYFFGIFKGTEEKIYFFKSLFHREKSLNDVDESLLKQQL